MGTSDNGDGIMLGDTWAWRGPGGESMITIADIVQGIEAYKDQVGYKPERIALTQEQMRAVRRDALASKYLDHDSTGMVTIAGVRVDVWGAPPSRRACARMGAT